MWMSGGRELREAMPLPGATWRTLAQLGASVAERAIFEDFGVTSVSADLALILADSLGIEVIAVNQGNLATVLPRFPPSRRSSPRSRRGFLLEVRRWFRQPVVSSSGPVSAICLSTPRPARRATSSPAL